MQRSQGHSRSCRRPAARVVLPTRQRPAHSPLNAPPAARPQHLRSAPPAWVHTAFGDPPGPKVSVLSLGPLHPEVSLLSPTSGVHASREGLATAGKHWEREGGLGRSMKDLGSRRCAPGCRVVGACEALCSVLCSYHHPTPVFPARFWRGKGPC